MNEKAFERLVKEAVKEIPQEFLEKLENVTILVEDFPAHYQIEKLKERNLRGFLLGLYEGVPQIRRGRYGIGGQIPDKITIFRSPILAIARDVEHLKEIIKDTVIHEIAHHFGFSEEQINYHGSKIRGIPRAEKFVSRFHPLGKSRGIIARNKKGQKMM